MAGSTDLELNGVPVRAGAPLPVQLIGGGATPGDVNIKQFGGTAVGAALGINDNAGDEAAKAELVRAGVTGRDLAAAANSRNVPISADLASVLIGGSRTTASIEGLYSIAILAGPAIGSTTVVIPPQIASALVAQAYTAGRLAVDSVIRGDDGATYSAISARGNNAGKNSNFPRAAIGAVVNARPQVADQCLEATAAINTGVTLTIPSPGAGLRQYITRIKIEAYYGAALVAAAAPIIVTTGGTAGIPGTPTWNTPTGTAQGAKYDIVVENSFPIEASADAGTVTIVCPANASIIWKVTAWWYNA